MIFGLRLLLAIALSALLAAGAAQAGSFVEFPNVSDRAPPLVGYLARPDAGLSGLIAGPEKQADRYAAVVVLHGCAGISSAPSTSPTGSALGAMSRWPSTASARAA